MRLNRAVAAGLLLPALAFGVVACGDDDEPSGGSADTTTDAAPAGGEVTVYSSLPLQGAQRPQTTDMVNGIKLALKQAGNKAGAVHGQVRLQGRLERPGRHLDG